MPRRNEGTHFGQRHELTRMQRMLRQDQAPRRLVPGLALEPGGADERGQLGMFVADLFKYRAHPY